MCGACEPLAAIMATPPPLFDEHMPGPGTLYLTSLPRKATMDVVIRHIRDGERSSHEDRVPAGVPIVVEMTNLPGTADRLEVNGVVCDGSYPIQENMETDVVVILADAGCRVEVRRVHAQNAPVHGETTGVVFGWAPVGSTIGLRPLGPDGEERHTDSDPDGSFRFFDLLAGAYELAVEVDGEVVQTRTIEVPALGEVYLELVEPPG